MPRITITVPGKNTQPYRFQLDRQVVSMGRGSENDIAIDSGSVSVTHAEMRRVEGGYELHDIGSTHGMKLDGVRHEAISLRNGATVKIGDVVFDFALSAEESEALAREKPQESSAIMRESELPVASKLERHTDTAPCSTRTGLKAALMFLVLAAMAFFTGLAVRHQNQTGNSLIEVLKMRVTVDPASVISPQPIELPAAK